MPNRDKNYLTLILIHVLIGLAIYGLPVLAKFYSVGMIIFGLFFVIRNRNRNNEVLYAAAYVVGSEVFLRMTSGNINYEFAKYSVVVFCIIGFFYSGFSKNAVPYWIYLLLLVPSIIIATEVLSLANQNIRKTIMFNISGPICLGVASLYTYNRKVRIEQINNILLVIGLPIISCVVYLLFVTPNIKDVLLGTGSNARLSGGFGPNQVSTILGLGMFIFFSRLILDSKTKIVFLVNLVCALYISYRGMLTFSRGGMMTGFVMIIVLMVFVYVNSKDIGKIKLNYFFFFVTIAMVTVWLFTSYKTDGLIDKRYANKDSAGREKVDNFTGRGEIAQGEIEMFLEHPFFGVGVAKGSEIRSEQMGLNELFASHDEVTRMLAEHGSLGILALIILVFTPIFLFLDNKQHIYMFSFLLFWFLTINHAAMRTASPAFIYALALLKVHFDEK
jgi:hypothetical protein